MPFGSSQWMYATGTAVEGQSLRFNDDDSAYLSWTPASAGNRKTWTWSGWVKRGNLPSTDVYLFGNSNGSNQGFHVRFDSGDTLTFLNYPSSASGQLTTSRVFRDTSAWYHIVLVWDTTDATSGDRMRMYINGERETDFGTSSYPSLNLDGTWNSTSYGDHAIGRNNYNGRYFDGYMAEVNFVDGLALDPTSFGETDANGQWVPIKEPSVTYGTNGFYLPFTNDYQVEGFNTVTYRGTSTNHYVGGVGFEPDLVWVKNRGTTNSHNLFDSIRGAGYMLSSDDTNAEIDNTAYFTGFEPDGFTMALNGGDTNYSGYSYVAWNWDMGTGSAASNTDGSITSSVKANPTYGQSVITYTGTGASATVGHGLSSAPEALIVKSRGSATAWRVWWSGFTGTERLQLSDNSSKATTNTSWDGTVPAASVFSLGADSNTNNSGTDYVAYAFHSVAGYSSFGSYSGNGSSTGPTATTGFKPAFVMIKRTDYAGGWIMFDNTRTPYNPLDKYLRADSYAAEVTASAYKIDFNSNGFQLKGTGNDINQSGGTYIYMAFADKREAAFWLDQSGNNNDWTNNNMQESDISLDSPTNNFATLNPLDKDADYTLSEGNLKADSSVSGYGACKSTFAYTSGKWYWEVALTGTGARSQIGIAKTTLNPTNATNGTAGTLFVYGLDGTLYYNGSSQGAYMSGGYTTGDIIGVALNLDNNEITFYKNGTSYGVAQSGIDDVDWTPTVSDSSTTYGTFFVANFGQDSSFAGNKVAQGNTDENGYGDFYYEPPAGYLALCTQNLPDPAVADGSEYFNTVLYTGDGTSSRSITGVGFQPDFVWLKTRSVADNHVLQDAVRGNDRQLFSNTAEAELNNSTTQLLSFDSDGFTIGSDSGVNGSGRTFASWNWKANGSGTSNTDGSITSTVSANTTAGFSIVSYTGTGSAATVGHGLSAVPQMVIVKNRADESDWLVYHKDSIASGFDAEDSFISLNGTGGVTDSATPWNNTAPTSSVFSVGTSNSTNGSSDNMIAYCFHGVEGYSKFGSYTGSGSTDGPFVYTGFRPAFVMIKAVDTTVAPTYQSWKMLDAARYPENAGIVPPALWANRSYTEGARGNGSAATYVPRNDLLSNGFKLGGPSSYEVETNQSGIRYIYMAFAESPFKYSNAR